MDSYVFRPEPLLDCPVHVLAGASDPHTDPIGLRAWGRHTRGTSDVRLFPSGHFFVHEAEQEVHRYLDDTLAATRVSV